MDINRINNSPTLPIEVLTQHNKIKMDNTMSLLLKNECRMEIRFETTKFSDLNLLRSRSIYCHNP